MIVYKINNTNDVGVTTSTYATKPPQDLSTCTNVDVTVEVFKKNAPLFTDYIKLLEACYKEQVYNDAVKATLASFATTQVNTGESNV